MIFWLYSGCCFFLCVCVFCLFVCFLFLFFVLLLLLLLNSVYVHSKRYFINWTFRGGPKILQFFGRLTCKSNQTIVFRPWAYKVDMKPFSWPYRVNQLIIIEGKKRHKTYQLSFFIIVCILYAITNDKVQAMYMTVVLTHWKRRKENKNQQSYWKSFHWIWGSKLLFHSTNVFIGWSDLVSEQMKDFYFVKFTSQSFR